jgi:hypothetical protein
MTLYLVFERLEQGRLRLDTPLRVSAKAAAEPPSKLGLRPGSTISVENAILALVTRSANDVAAVIAENLGGSVEAFAREMTSTARGLGMTKTVFRNAHGLPDRAQVTTARDLTLLAIAVQDRFPEHYKYFQRRSFTFSGTTHRNHNRLLGRVEGVDGIKTGFIRASGFNLMTNAKTRDRHIVTIVLGGRSGAHRDGIVERLVQNNLPRAFAGARQTPRMTGSGRAFAAAPAAADVDPASRASRRTRSRSRGRRGRKCAAPGCAGPASAARSQRHASRLRLGGRRDGDHDAELAAGTGAVQCARLRRDRRDGLHSPPAGRYRGVARIAVVEGSSVQVGERRARLRSRRERRTGSRRRRAAAPQRLGDPDRRARFGERRAAGARAGAVQGEARPAQCGSVHGEVNANGTTLYRARSPGSRRPTTPRTPAGSSSAAASPASPPQLTTTNLRVRAAGFVAALSFCPTPAAYRPARVEYQRCRLKRISLASFTRLAR